MNARLALLVGAICAVLASVGVSIGAGLFANLPLMGGPSYCAGTSSGPLGPVCTVTVPAGPATFTGTEVFPYDSLVPSGGASQSALASSAQLGGGSKAINTGTVTPITGGNHITYEILDTGTPATFTVNTPAGPFDGEKFVVVCAVAVGTTLTISPSAGQTIKTAPAAAACTASTTYAFMYNAANTTWYRIQ
jgi:hypothetical protein